MSPAKRKQIDPLEKAIEAALSPDRFMVCRPTLKLIAAVGIGVWTPGPMMPSA